MGWVDSSKNPGQMLNLGATAHMVSGMHRGILVTNSFDGSGVTKIVYIEDLHSHWLFLLVARPAVTEPSVALPRDQ